MLDAVIHFSLRRRWLVLAATAFAAAFGAWSFTQLPIDAVPDITNVQVQVNTEAPGFSPLEIEQRITVPIETTLAGLPRLDHTRSLSRYGLSQVTVVFEDGTDVYFARQLIGERLREAAGSLPPGVEPTLGPIATGLGEIFSFTMAAEPGALDPQGRPWDATSLRTLQDWVVRPQLRGVSGVAEVSTIGGFAQEIHVTPRPERLVAYGLSFRDLLDAIARNNANVGAGYIEKNGEQVLVRAPGQVAGPEDVERIVVGLHEGVPVRVAEVAEVGPGRELRTGAATLDGEEVVLGTVIMLLGENSRSVSQRVAAKLAEVNETLPEGVVTRTVYDRSELVERTIATVERNLVEGALLVVVVLFLLLGNVRAAFLTALVIPLSMLLTFAGMARGRISGNLMSLGALDFGLIVDGAVIIVENCIRRLAEAQAERGGPLPLAERLDTVAEATRQVVRPSVFGVTIILIVYVPILALAGVEGKMFQPMAITVILALLAALLLSVTFVPAAVAVFLGGRVRERENALMGGARRGYAWVLEHALARPLPVLAAAAALAAGALGLASGMGREFIPTLDEGDVAVQALRIPGTSLTQSIAMQKGVERALLALPEVSHTMARIGTAEIATDPMPPSIADGYVMLKPRSAWPDPEKPKARLVTEIEERLATQPGNSYEISQPIELRFNELIAGVRSDVAVKIFGDDFATLQHLGEEVAGVLEGIRGAADVKAEQGAGLPFLEIRFDRAALARFGLSLDEVQEVARIAIGGEVAGQVFEGDRRFDLVVR
ncbi:MAG: CusA/CzcA family heavy metal efflux RND transporter, partial [Deltaproteobacteria bacterium]|nr:CusA/CzcA family heavy metal efflux RND transporter [Deltaproteobacteria bacterium]